MIYNAEQFRTKMYDTINESNLDFATAFFILKDIYRDMKEEYERLSQIPPQEGKEEEELYNAENEKLDSIEE